MTHRYFAAWMDQEYGVHFDLSTGSTPYAYDSFFPLSSPGLPGKHQTQKDDLLLHQASISPMIGSNPL
jgi:hypothetical protein